MVSEHERGLGGGKEGATTTPSFEGQEAAATSADEEKCFEYQRGTTVLRLVMYVPAMRVDEDDRTESVHTRERKEWSMTSGLESSKIADTLP